MSQAEELLNGLPGNEPTVYTVEPDTEPHIVVNADRTITIPEELKHIAVQFDHNIETVTFDCPRFWDEHDFSTMKVYIVYQRPDGYRDKYPVRNLCVDNTDAKMIHFDWTISKKVTPIKGNISFIVCINDVNDSGIETNHWNSRLNQDLVVDEGLECSNSEIVELNPDILEYILARLDSLGQDTSNGVTMTDRATGTKYVVYVDNGKLTMAKSKDNDIISANMPNGVTMTDRTTGIKYSVYVSNGKLTMTENELTVPDSGGGFTFVTDETLKLEDGVLSVNTTNDMDQDNTLPITSAGVYTAVGNIEASLQTI